MNSTFAEAVLVLLLLWFVVPVLAIYLLMNGIIYQEEDEE